VTALVSLYHYWPGSSYEGTNLKSVRCSRASLATDNPSIDPLICATALGGDDYFVVSPIIHSNVEIKS